MKRILEILDGAFFLIGTIAICLGLCQGLKNAVKYRYENNLQKIEKKSVDFLEQTDRMPLP